MTSTLMVLVLAMTMAACGGGDDFEPPAGGPSQPGPGQGVVGAPSGCDPVTNIDPTTGAPCTPGDVGGGGGATELPDVDGSTVKNLGQLSDDSDLFAAQANMSGIEETPDTGSSDTSPAGEVPFGKAVPDEQVGMPTTEPKPTTTVSYGPAVIEVDGKTHTVAVDGVFPSDSRQFTLTRLTSDSATINLTAGEFSGGHDGITLTKGKTVTLVNQTGGVSYQIKLVKVNTGR